MRVKALILSVTTWIVLATASPAQAITVTGSITPSDPTRSQSLSPSTATTCAAAGSAISGAGAFHYDAYTFGNTSASTQCATVTWTSSQLAFVSAYSSFNPANANANLLGFPTNCAGGDSFSFNVPANSSFTVVIEECSENVGVGSYTLDASGTGIDRVLGAVTASDTTRSQSLSPNNDTSCTQVGSGVPGPGAFHYDAYTYTNPSATPRCATVSWTSAQLAVVTAYTSFDPANASANRLGAKNCSTNTSVSFTVPANSAFTVVIEECGQDDGVSSYTMDVTLAPPPTAAPIRSFAARRTTEGLLVSWRTAAEVGVVGFDVYREVGGKRERVTSRIVRAAGAGAGRVYAFLDRAAPRGKALRYWLRTVSLDGSRAWYGPALVRTPTKR